MYRGDSGGEGEEEDEFLANVGEEEIEREKSEMSVRGVFIFDF